MRPPGPERPGPVPSFVPILKRLEALKRPIYITYCAGVNDNGVISGIYNDTAGAEHAFLRTPGGALQNIDDPGTLDTGAGNINDATWIPGHIVDSSVGLHALLISPSRYRGSMQE